MEPAEIAFGDWTVEIEGDDVTLRICGNRLVVITLEKAKATFPDLARVMAEAQKMMKGKE